MKKDDNLKKINTKKQQIRRKMYLRLLKLIISSSLSYGGIKAAEYYKDISRVPSIDISLERNTDMGFGEFPIKPYDYSMIRVFQKEKMIEELELVVEKYASIFCFDKESVLGIIKANTNNFDSDDFIWNKNITGTDVVYEDFTSQICLLTFDMYMNPENYNEFEIVRCYDIEPQVGDMTIREFVYETADIMGVDRDMALGIACLESGYFKIMASYDSYGTGRRFNNVYHGIIFGIYNIKNNYINYGLTTLDSMAPKYCPPNKDTWAGQVRAVTNNVNSWLKLYDEYDKELTYLKN